MQYRICCVYILHTINSQQIFISSEVRDLKTEYSVYAYSVRIYNSININTYLLHFRSTKRRFIFHEKKLSVCVCVLGMFDSPKRIDS